MKKLMRKIQKIPVLYIIAYAAQKVQLDRR